MLVMHNTHGIVWNTKCWRVGVFLEVVFLTFLDVGPVDRNILVSVISAMDMEGTKGMDKLMNDGAKGKTNSFLNEELTQEKIYLEE